MQSPLYPCRSGTARPFRWRRILSTLTIVAIGALSVYAAAHSTHAIVPPHPIAARAVITGDVALSPASPTLDSPATTCDAASPHRSVALSPSGGATCPLPDLWLDDRDDDDDDDDLHRGSVAARTHLKARETLDLRRSRVFETAVISDGQIPNQFLLESVRRM